jgi:hypothetical protein
VTSLF